MDSLNELLRPRWGSEKWILEGWEKINSDEKKLITERLNELFKDGLPFDIKHDKSLYIYAFSLLAQLEVLAIQIPLKFQDKMISQENKERMHTQLLDEIFHGLVFTKILYMLCDPYALPPEYNNNVEMLCNYVRNEECPKVAVMLLNLIAEGWIEEGFKCYAQQNIAPKVFKVILADEHRHVCEADLYTDVGLPDRTIMKKKLEYLEEQLLVNFFLQHRYVIAASALLGFEGMSNFMQSLNAKHHQQLKKINLEPSKKWITFMQLMQNMLPIIHAYSQKHQEIEMTPMRKILMTQWDNSSEATMVSQSNIDVSCIDFFNKKFPSETLTTLMMQSISLWLKENEVYRSYLHYRKLYQSKEAYVGVIALLPGCGDHMGTIAFANCHEMSVAELSQRIRDILPMMVYCYKRREELEKAYPHLKPYDENKLLDFAYNVYGYPLPGSSIVTISNVGPWGYTDAKSPLLKNESVKFVMMQIERKQVWNKKRQTFEIQDHLPISISADHRIFDGNTPVPQMLNDAFQRMFQKMNGDLIEPIQQVRKPINSTHFIKNVEAMLNLNVDFGYKYINALQTVWADFLTPESLLTSMESIKAATKSIFEN
ncbi:2-oxo acid dehydrogenase subunit E2 [Legionella sp.]|uniref:2-oxo acid dehydrogenase subunit E2 n=1 Tax=Legionella sp. TaxID=459 RepID=UPI003C8E2D43